MSAALTIRKHAASSTSFDAFDLLAAAGRHAMAALRAIQPARATMPAYARLDAGLAAPIAVSGIDWTDAEVRRLPL